MASADDSVVRPAVLLIALIANAGLIGAAWLCGFRTRSLHDLHFTPGEAAAVRLLSGMGFLGVGLFLIGQVTWGSSLTIGVVAAGVFAFGLRSFRQDIVDLIRTFTPSVGGWIAAGILLFLAIAGFAERLGPWGDDGIGYHLLGPKVWLREHHIIPVMDYFATSYPSTMEVLFGVLMGAANPNAIGFFGVLTGVLFVVLAHGLTKLLTGSESVCGLSMALVATTPIISGFMTEAFVDVPFSAFALVSIRLGLTATRVAHFVMIGAFLGYAAGSKYTGLIVIATTLPIIAGRQLVLSRGLKHTFVTLLVVSVVAGVVCCPWYVRNWIVLGTPIYPLPILGDIFTPRWMPPESIRAFVNYTLHGRGGGMGRGWVNLPPWPFRFTFHTNLFNGAGGIGLVPLGFAALGLYLCRRNQTAIWLTTWTIGIFLGWFFTQQEARFLLHALVIAFVFGSIAVGAVLMQANRLNRILTWAVLFVSIGYGAAYVVLNHFDQFRSVFSPSFARQRYLRMAPHHAAFEYVNRTDGVDRVLVLDPYVATYYFDKPYYKPVCPYGIFLEEGIRTPQDAAREARRFGVTHIFDVKNENSTSFTVTPDLGYRLVFESDDARVYAIH
jgi:hypothetical protein